MSQSRIIVALDFDDIESARQLVARISPKLCRLKVGKEMFTAFGPGWVRELVQQGFDVFLDLKFHDIPNTVAKACKAAAQLGVWMINVHASGGVSMMEAARQAVDQGDQKNKPLLIAVTALTSLQSSDFHAFGSTLNVDQIVLNLAKQAQAARLDGVVSSALEAPLLRRECGESFCLVTPGIRLPGSSDDQKRVLSPAAAVANGSDYLVIGRPITQSKNPLSTLESIICDI